MHQKVRRIIMNNPWEEISLDDYENHMSLDSVKNSKRILLSIYAEGTSCQKAHRKPNKE